MDGVRIDRGRWGGLPYTATGHGEPLIVLAGLSGVAGVVGDREFGTIVAPVGQLAASRRLIVLNRWSGMPDGLTMGELAARYDEAVCAGVGGPIDVLGVSTGGSIAQQWAADHPATVRRLVLVSTACRLGPVGRDLQARVGQLLRAGSVRPAAAVVVGALAPAGLRTVARALGWAAAPMLLGGPTAAADLAVTVEAEDAFDLAGRPTIQAPTLIVAGGRDRFYGPALFVETARLIPNRRLAVFPGRGHVGVVADRRARATIAGFLTG